MSFGCSSILNDDGETVDWSDDSFDAWADLEEETAKTDYIVFRRLWESSADRSPQFGCWPRSSLFLSLRILRLQLHHVQQLAQIIYTSSFPNLRVQSLQEGSDFEVHLAGLFTLRRTITEEAGDARGEFYLPSEWDNDSCDILGQCLHVAIPAGGSVPPPSPEELATFPNLSSPRPSRTGMTLTIQHCAEDLNSS
ncbi:hypothetical protein JCM11641_001749 [Rhodosporidiobolus odoratus]